MRFKTHINIPAFSSGLKVFFALVMGLSLWIGEDSHAQTVIDANDRGWYNASGTHNPNNNNTFTGDYRSSNYRSYFRFSIPAGITCVASAVLELELENYYGDGSAHSANIFDVDPANVPLLDTSNGSGNGVAIYTDLGTGLAYGSQGGLTSADVGSILNFTLPAGALTNIAAASGSDFAVGTMTITGGGASLSALRYSAGNANRTHRLTFTECPPLPILGAVKTVEVFDPDAEGLYALPGNDVIYTITVTNSGPGVVDTDTMFLVDKIPDNTVFYNGDIDGAGPEINPVAFDGPSSGLTFDYAMDIAYSDLPDVPADFASCLYSPPTIGYDVNIKYICINPKDSFTTGTPDPEFSVSFRVRID